ncbi:hypothetical protein [Hyphomonas sp. UBA5107]|uniref:hypothetical protein n=1 Tax=Hyphomonas sp. UBA5107 TaxID=1946636 RepID=UPI0039C8BB3F
MLTESGNDYVSLAEKLNVRGIDITGRGPENKISRGGFRQHSCFSVASLWEM